MKCLLVAAALLCPAFAQPDASPRFEAADVRTAAKAQSAFPRTGPVRNGRYEIRNASIVDLIRTAYGFDADHILGGPSWLEMDRFDVAAKVPEHSTAEDLKPMLQSLLEERFQLKARKDTKPMPAYALTATRKPNFKESDGSGETGCRFKGAADGRITIGADFSLQFACTNMTMQRFAENLRGMLGANLDRPVFDESGLEGRWNFDVHWSLSSLPILSNTVTQITVFDALEKQLGLKLVEKQVPAPVIIVDSVNRRPSENPPGTAEALPPAVVPTEFEVASIKPIENMDPRHRRSMRNEPGGRVTMEGMSLSFLVSRAFNNNTRDGVAGLPAFADTTYFDINAKAAMNGAANLDTEALAPFMLSLMKDRFKMAYHTEERPVTAYTLTAAKPKLKKADPQSRTRCTGPNSPPGTPPGARVLRCQNISMEEFVDKLQNLAAELTWPVTDSTGLEGRWDLTLTYSPNAGRAMPVLATGAAGGAGTVGVAVSTSDSPVPAAQETLQGYTLFEALEKQLGLKLVSQKRPAPVIVIDHIEQKPTEN
ncbi:MAG TPA: TIGR03435 family protein [Candidatus Limnocylindrales bacterium]|nr:TIGR03435 family protein [Candidatus Limnocylindrales bacterium]